jgi:hypothetical protein
VFNIIVKFDTKESPLTLAAYKGHLEMVSYLLSVIPKGPESEEEVKKIDYIIMILNCTKNILPV